MQKRKKRRVKGTSRLSFADEVDNGSDEEVAVNSKDITLLTSWVYVLHHHMHHGFALKLMNISSYASWVLHMTHIICLRTFSQILCLTCLLCRCIND